MKTQQETFVKQQASLEKAAELRRMIANLEKVDDESRRHTLLDSLCSVDDILSLPLHPDPPSIQKGNLRVDLLRHQVRSLSCCYLSVFKYIILVTGASMVYREGTSYFTHQGK